MFRDFFDDPFFGFKEHHHRARHYEQIEKSNTQNRSNQGRILSNEQSSRRDVSVPNPFRHSAFSSPMNSLMNMRDSSSMFDMMMPNMHDMMNQAFSQSFNSESQDGFGYSSYSVASYINDGNDRPKVFQASRSTSHAPGGIKETRRALRDTEVGLEKMAVGRHIRDRGHVITRERNLRNGEMMENQDFQGFAEEDAGQFDRDWMRETDKYRGKAHAYLKDSRAPIRPQLNNKAEPKSKH